VHDQHVHAAPPGAAVALRSLRASRDRRGAVLAISCLGPADCAGIVRLTLRAGRRVLPAGRVAFVIPRLRTHTVVVRHPASILRRLRGGRRLAFDVRAATRSVSGGAGTTSTRRFGLRLPAPRR